MLGIWLRIYTLWAEPLREEQCPSEWSGSSSRDLRMCYPTGRKDDPGDPGGPV